MDPDKAAGHLSMATWHAEIVNAAGPMAGFLYGASARKARRHYDRTLELMPDAKVVCVEYAFGLLLMDEEGNREEARGLLEQAVKKTLKGRRRPALSQEGDGAIGRPRGKRREIILIINRILII